MTPTIEVTEALLRIRDNWKDINHEVNFPQPNFDLILEKSTEIRAMAGVIRAWSISATTR